MKVIRIMLADRHPIVRLGLRKLMEDTSDVELVGESDNAMDVLQLTRSLKPDILILGMNLPPMRSLEVARQLYEARDSMSVLVLSAFEEEQYVFEMLAYGVAAYLTKEEAPETIVQTIREANGGTVGQLSQRVMARLGRLQQEARLVSVLSQREQDVLCLMARGYRNAAIAETLFISADTVKNHITSIYSKLDTPTRAEAIAWAWRHGLGA